MAPRLPDPPRVDRRRADRFDAYLAVISVAVLVAAAGAILVYATGLDSVGLALLLGGDVVVVAAFVSLLAKS